MQSKHVLKTSASLTFFLLAACAPVAGPWHQLEGVQSKAIPGALNVGGATPAVVYRCGPQGDGFIFTGSGCDYAFTDSSGRKLSVWTLLKEIDVFAEKLPSLKPLINADANRACEFPYTMHLLTISPAVVLLVPRTRTESFDMSNTCHRVVASGCLQSQSFKGNNYWFNREPTVRDGSLWFTLEKPGQIFPLDASGTSSAITTPGAALTLTRRDEKWLVTRTR